MNSNRAYFWFGIAAIVIMVICIYWPGLSGDFEFDDGVNILENKKLLLESLEWGALKRSYFSGDAGPLGRPLSMLTFALNYYFFGFDPYYFKLVNVLLHAMNGVLLFLLARQIGLFLEPASKSQRAVIVASLFFAILWAVAPINLTSVLYVVQRMTSLASMFTLLALLAYVSFRVHSLRSPCLTRFVWGWIVIGLAAFVASLLCKESGVLTPGYAFVLELAVFRFARNKNGQWRLHWLLIALFLLMAIAAVGGLAWQLANQDRLGFGAGYALRDFTLEQRLLTQPRVLAFYLKQTVLPDIAVMGLYHDDFLTSTSITQPLETAYAIGGWCVALLFAAWAAIRAPLLSMPILWFLIGHTLESSFFPLEMVHEHRNYLPSAGIYLLPVIAIWIASKKNKLKWPVVVGCCLLLLLLAMQTWIRADQWGGLVDHAAIEAHNHPKSERANYQLGRMYFKLFSNNRTDEYFLPAMHYFKVASDSSGGQNGGLFALIQLSFMARKPIDPAWVDVLADRVEHRPPYASNVPFFNALLDCQVAHYCKLPDQDVFRLLEAALRNRRASNDTLASLHSMLGVYIIQKNGNGKAAERHLLAAFEKKPMPDHALNISGLYLITNDFANAERYIHLAERLDKHGYFDKEIARQRALLP